MANPRFAIDFTDIKPVDVTYKIDASTILFDRTLANGSAQVGLAVGLKAATSGVVELVADAQAVHGRLERVEPDGMCVVRVGGYAQLPGGTGATLTRGSKIVGALLVAAKGYIRSAVAAESPAGAHQIVDPTSTTAVWVMLGD